MSNDDACTNVCKLATCGDGFKQPGRPATWARTTATPAACTLACKLPVCGDVFVQMGAEECDDGNQSTPTRA
jgi:hypothetical protein